MSTTQIVILVVVIVAVVIGSVVGVGMLLTGVAVREGNEARDRLQCLNNLKQIGQLLLVRKAGQKLRQDDGEVHLLQTVKEIDYDDFDIFVCPGGPGEHEFGSNFVKVFCSYRGPDQAALASWKAANPNKDPIIACDANGDDGLHPQHPDGVCVLHESGAVGFIPWKEMQGYDGGPVQVGPDSPDARFRHLVR